MDRNDKIVPLDLVARLELRRSNAAQPHRNRYAEAKKPGKGQRKSWKKVL